MIHFIILYTFHNYCLMFFFIADEGSTLSIPWVMGRYTIEKRPSRAKKGWCSPNPSTALNPFILICFLSNYLIQVESFHKS